MLQVASLRGYENIFKLLIEKCADVNSEVREYGNALQAVSEKSHENIVQLLIERGADVQALDG